MKSKLDGQIKEVEGEVDGLGKRLHYLEVSQKNSKDQIQDFIWYLSKSRVSVDVEDIARRATRSKAKADATAGQYANSPDRRVLNHQQDTTACKPLGPCS